MSEEPTNKNHIMNKLPVISTIIRSINYDTHLRKSLETIRLKSDPKQLEQSALPDSEKLELHCCWVAEAFTPSNINNLYKSAKRLGWDDTGIFCSDRIPVSEKVKDARSRGGGSAYFPAGLIGKRKNMFDLIRGGKLFSKLPNGVERGDAWIHVLESSLTIVVIGFVFNDSMANSLNEPFNATYETNVKRRFSGIRLKGASYKDAFHQKRNAVRSRLDSIHKDLFVWFGRNIRGHFSTTESGELPTIDLITSMIFCSKEESKRNREMYSYLNIIPGLGTDQWDSVDFDNLELHHNRRDRSRDVMLFGNFKDLTKDIDSYGGPNRFGLTNRLSSHCHATMSIWATRNMLASFENQLAGIRDKATRHTRGVGNSIRRLGYIRKQFLSISSDVQVLSHDLGRNLENRFWMKEDCLDLKPHHDFDGRIPNFIETMRQQCVMATERLIELEKRVNQTIITSGNLASTIANLRVQRTVVWLTVIIAILTFILVLKIDIDTILHYITTF